MASDSGHSGHSGDTATPLNLHNELIGRGKCRTQEEVKEMFRGADAVLFDVDSTVIQDEALDLLAKFMGRYEEVSALTYEAMGGKMDFRESLTKRLNILNPNITRIEAFLEMNPPNLSFGIKPLIMRLKQRQPNCEVYLVSGGFKLLIEPIARLLGIPPECVYANELKFDRRGYYNGFNQDYPTSKQGGKAEVVDLLRKVHNFQSMVVIGDGITDMEACPPADAFIGYGGAVVREKVKERALWYVTSFQELIDAMD